MKKYIRELRNCELDCEKRAVKLMKEYNLPIDIKKYIKQANAYVYFYNTMIDTRKWYKKSPCIVKEILDIMPTKFERSYKSLPNKYLRLVKKYCI